MGCLAAITQAITNSCTTLPVAGLVKEAYIMNRSAVSYTVDGTNEALITAIALSGSEVAYKVTAVNKENNAGFDASVADNLPNLFTHYLSLQPYQRDSDSVKQLDTMDDIVAVVELNGPKTEGKFIILGYGTGLHLSSGSHRANDNNGIPTYEFATREGEGEKFSRYIYWDTDYDDSKTALEALLT